MNNFILGGALWVTLSAFSALSYAADGDKLVSKQEAIKAALAEVGVEVIGIRLDEPDS